MAIELTRKRVRALLSDRSQRMHVPSHVLAGLVIGVVVVVFSAMLLGTRDAHRDESTARQRYLDAEAIAALPPVSTDTLREEVEAAKAQLAMSQAVAARTVDATSDTTIASLVETAQQSGLSVRGVARADAATAKIGEQPYDVHGIRTTVEGTPAQTTVFLAAMRRDQPTLFPALLFAAVNEAGLVRSELVFNAYTAASAATPGAGPTAAGPPR